MALALSGAQAASAIAPLSFRGTEFIHRWSKDNQHEFTPKDQTDLNRWREMITINHYTAATDGDRLAGMANAVLENYKKNRAIVLRTDSKPRAAGQPAEHLIVAVFSRPDFIEAVFARFQMVDGVGTSVVYSHREYGSKVGDQMSAWLRANGPAIEKALMEWKGVPLLSKPKK